MESKNDKVRRLVSEGRYKEALQICKDWDYADPTHRDKLRRGYECLLYPDFYECLGMDPDKRYRIAVEILVEVYAR